MSLFGEEPAHDPLETPPGLVVLVANGLVGHIGRGHDERSLNRFEKHRRDRIRQVRDVLRERPDAVLEDLMEAVYGTTLPSAVRRSAELSLAALLDYARTVPE